MESSMLMWIFRIVHQDRVESVEWEKAEGENVDNVVHRFITFSFCHMKLLSVDTSEHSWHDDSRYRNVESLCNDRKFVVNSDNIELI